MIGFGISLVDEPTTVFQTQFVEVLVGDSDACVGLNAGQLDAVDSAGVPTDVGATTGAEQTAPPSFFGGAER